MTKWQGNIIIVFLGVVIFLLMLLLQNVFTGVATMSFKFDKTQALLEKAIPENKMPSPQRAE